MPFQKGQSGNPSGRKKGTKNKFSIAELQKSFKKAAKKHGGVSFLDYMADLAYTNDYVAVQLLKKLLPDLQRLGMVQEQPDGLYSSLTPAEALNEMLKDTAGLNEGESDE